MPRLSLHAISILSLQRVGDHSVDDKKKMTAQRCAELVAAAIAGKLDEAWFATVDY